MTFWRCYFSGGRVRRPREKFSIFEVNLQNRNRPTDLENEPLVARGDEWGEKIVRDSEMDMGTWLYLKWITSKALVYSTGNSAPCYVAGWIGGELEGEWIHGYVLAESLCCPPATITTLLTDYSPI